MKNLVYDSRQVRFNKMDLRPPPTCNSNPEFISHNEKSTKMKGE